jgi:hypothetical protein
MAISPVNTIRYGHIVLLLIDLIRRKGKCHLA